MHLRSYDADYLCVKYGKHREEGGKVAFREVLMLYLKIEHLTFIQFFVLIYIITFVIIFTY